ncbi:MAG: [FeFe] hydrogenase H-cluster radical SAM maturase HydE [Oscillospiraceae bacterium]|nr:[FeFe] hydrogenase H-cluster radical SAM maturase HydE [Oscillospiraceae bacterium]
MNHLVDKLAGERTLGREEFKELLTCDGGYLREMANKTRQQIFGNKIYMRGLIEFTNHCKQDCYYCGLRKSNGQAGRFRLSKNEILACCAEGYGMGFRTFVIQGGEDAYFTDEKMCEIIGAINQGYPDCAITLSLGERSRESYRRLKEAGADRYLLRQEASDAGHFASLHPPGQTLESRRQALRDLKELGFQVGCGFMVGTPGQTLDHIVDDLLFIKELDPAMVGIGPFIPHADTPFADRPQGDLSLTLNTLAILRLIKPNLLLPATTALGSIEGNGRELGILAGANVIMPNLSPIHARERYLLYNNKIATDQSAKSTHKSVVKRMADIGCEIVVGRGDYLAV